MMATLALAKRILLFLHIIFIPVSLILQLPKQGLFSTILWMFQLNVMIFVGLNLVYLLVANLQNDELPRQIFRQSKWIYLGSLGFMTLLFVFNFIRFIISH